MKNTILSLAAITMISFASCTTTKNVVNLEKSDVQTIQMKQGETYKVQLRENPSTGYSWNTKSSDNCAASLGNSTYKQDKAEAGMVGVPGNRTFEIKADKVGTCTFTFEQKPPGSSEVVSTKTLKVVVK